VLPPFGAGVEAYFPHDFCNVGAGIALFLLCLFTGFILHLVLFFIVFCVSIASF
jgi:hypothetical protein